MAKFTDGVFTITSPIQHRRGTTEALEQSDYIPAAGEIVIATDTGLMKAGDGIHTWADLPAGNQINSELESKIINLERILSEAGLNIPSDEDEQTDSEIDEIFDNIFSGNNSSEPAENNNDFDDTINSILNP